MQGLKAFFRKKDIEISLQRYGIDALGAMAQGLFCSLLIGTIINTLGTLFHIGVLTSTVATISGTDYTVGGLAMAMSGPAMAAAIAFGSFSGFERLIVMSKSPYSVEVFHFKSFFTR